jgi:hypothetical protein
MVTTQWQRREEKIEDWVGHDPLRSVGWPLISIVSCRLLVPGFRNKTVGVHNGELLGYSRHTAEIL